MWRIVLLVAFCGCSSQMAEPVNRSDAGQCMCEYCAGPQYPVGGHAPICAGEYRYESCPCGDSDAGTAFNVQSH